MGEMADFYVDMGIEQMLDPEFCEAHSVVFACRRNGRPAAPVKCRDCGKKNLKWGKVHNRKTEYQLQELDGTPHCCDLSSAMPNLEDEESP